MSFFCFTCVSCLHRMAVFHKVHVANISFFCNTIHFTSNIFAYFSRFLFSRSRFGVFPGQKAFPVRLIPVPFPFSVCPLSENDKKRKEQMSGAKPFFRIDNRFPRDENRQEKSHKACAKKHKAYILKYKALILK